MDGDAKKFGASWAGFSRASVFPSLALGLERGRQDSRAGVFIEKLEKAMAERLAQKPERMVIPLATVVVVEV